MSIEIFRHDFDTLPVDWQNITSPNTEEVYEELDQLNIILPNATNRKWGPGGADKFCPIVYKTPIPQSGTTSISYYAKLPSFGGSWGADPTVGTGLTLFSDNQNAYILIVVPPFTGHLNWTIDYNQLVADAFSGFVHGTIIDPNISPVIFKITWHPSTGTADFLFSQNDGASFTPINTGISLGFVPTKIGLFSKNWYSLADGYVGSTAKYDWLYAEEQSGLTEIYRNDFDFTTTNDIPQGKIQKSSNAMIFRVAQSTNHDWWETDELAPVAYEQTLSYLPTATVTIFAKLVYYTTTGDIDNRSATGVALFTDRDNAYFFTVKPPDSIIPTDWYFSLQKVVSNTASTVVTKTTVSNGPNSVNITFRITWDTDTNTADFDFFHDVGFGWQNLATGVSFDFTPTNAGLFLKNWPDKLNGANAYYDWFYGEQTGGVTNEVPRVIDAIPSADSKDVPVEKPISFSIVDNTQVDLTETNIWVRGTLVFNGTSFQSGYTTSTYAVNTENGYDFLIIPDALFQWEQGEEIPVRVLTKDEFTNETDESWSFTAEITEIFPFSIYKMILRSVTEKDEKSPGTLKTITDGLDSTWKSYIFDKMTELQETSRDPSTIDAKWLPWLKSLVGFTQDLSFSPTEAELRKIITGASQYWNNKPSQSALEIGIRLITPNRFRIRNYFDFRTQVDTTYITEELEDFDPNMIDFPSRILSGTKLYTCIGSADYPCKHTFFIDDTTIDWQNEVWAPNLYKWLVITDYPTATGNVGIYNIDFLDTEIPGGRILGGDGFFLQSANYGTWKLYGANEDYVTEIRLVDDPSGYGLVNREILNFLLEQIRAMNERLDIVYIDFLDEFTRPNEIDLWNISGNVTLPDPGGTLYIPAGASILDDSAFSSAWGDQSTIWKLEGDSTSSVAKLIFFYTDASNYYYVQLEYGTRLVKLFKMDTGTPTQIGSSVYLSYIRPNTQDTVRVNVWTESTDRIKVRVNGEVEIDVNIVTPHVTAGGVGAEAVGDIIKLKMVEVNVLPTTIERVGPLP